MRAIRVAALLAGVALGAAAALLLSTASTIASTPDPIVGEWSLGTSDPPALIIKVTGSDGNYVGKVVKNSLVDRCMIPVGKLIWTIRGSAPTYSGTHMGFNANCTDLPIPVSFIIADLGGDGLQLEMHSPGFGLLRFLRLASDDKTAPVVTIEAPKRIIGIGDEITVRWSATDDSRKAQATLTLYSGGDIVASDSTRGLIKATGKVHEEALAPVADHPGPFYACVSAVDAAGNSSATAAGPKCTWLSVQVRVPTVSNGCGGAQFGPTAAAIQNWFLDTQTYGGETVNFRAACNQHDAGYSGATVYDPFLKRVVDFRTWSRARVDEKFEEDLKALCRKYLDDRTVTDEQMRDCTDGPSAADVLLSVGAFEPGARAYYEGVREYALAAFDTNVAAPGVQTDNNPSTWPVGGGRSNT